MTQSHEQKAPLTGKNIVVTGATGTIGKHIALTLGKAGATVILVAPKERRLNEVYDALLSEGAAEPAMIPFDFLEVTPNDYFGLAAALTEEFGAIDGVIHAAGHLGSLTPLAHTSTDHWQKNIAINLEAPFQLTQALLPLLTAKEERASVLFLEHPEVASGDHAYWGSYAIAKAGLHTMMKLFATEFEAQASIQFNSLNPVAIDSALRYNASPEGVENPHALELLSPFIIDLMDSEKPFTTGECFTLNI